MATQPKYDIEAAYKQTVDRELSTPELDEKIRKLPTEMRKTLQRFVYENLDQSTQGVDGERKPFDIGEYRRRYAELVNSPEELMTLAREYEQRDLQAQQWGAEQMLASGAGGDWGYRVKQAKRALSPTSDLV